MLWFTDGRRPFFLVSKGSSEPPKARKKENKVAMFGFKKRGATRGLPSGSPKPVLLSPKHA